MRYKFCGFFLYPSLTLLASKGGRREKGKKEKAWTARIKSRERERKSQKSCWAFFFLSPFYNQLLDAILFCFKAIKNWLILMMIYLGETKTVILIWFQIISATYKLYFKTLLCLIKFIQLDCLICDTLKVCW